MSHGKQLGVVTILVLTLSSALLVACAQSPASAPGSQPAAPPSPSIVNEHVNVRGLDIVMKRARVIATETPWPVAPGNLFVDVSMEVSNGGSTAVDLRLGSLTLEDSTGRTFAADGVSMTPSGSTNGTGVSGALGPLQPGATIRFTPRWAVPRDANGLVFVYTVPGAAGTVRFRVN